MMKVHRLLGLAAASVFVQLWREHVHYNDVIMNAMASQTPASRLFTQPFAQAKIEENIKAPRYWPLWGEFTGDQWIPLTEGQ